MITIEQIKERATLPGVLMGFMRLKGLTSEAQFVMFWESTPESADELWADFRKRQRESKYEDYGWTQYANDILREHSLRYARPKSCMQPEGFLGDHIAQVALQKMVNAGKQMTDTELLSAHREEQPALGKLQPYLCKGCNMPKCPVYPKHIQRRRRRRY